MTTYSIDQNLTTTSSPTFDDLTLTGAIVGTLTLEDALNEAAEFEVSSSSTTAIGAAASNNVRIAGSTTITGFDDAPAGVTRRVRFTGALTLTHSAALVLPGGTNITTASGDYLEAVSMGSGNWRVAFYQPLAGVGPKAAITGGTLDSVSITNSTIIADASGLKVEDSNGDVLSIATGELTANRTFTIDPDNGNRTLTVAADAALDQNVTTASSPQFTAVNVGHVSDTTVSRASAGVIAVEGINVLASNSSGVQTFLTTPSSANLAAAVTDEEFGTGGKLLFGDQQVSTDDNVQHATLALGGARTEGVVQLNPGAAGTVTAPVGADELVVEGSGNAGIAILCPDANTSALNLGSPSDSRGASLEWNYSGLNFNVGTDVASGVMRLRAGDATAMAELSTAGLTVHASGVTPQHDGTLHVMEGSAGTVTVNTQVNTIVAESNGNGGITIVTPDANGGYLDFTSPSTTTTQGGRVEWSYTNGAFGISTNKSGGKLQFLVDSQSQRGEWNASGLTVHANGVTPQHDAPLHVMKGTAGTWDADSGAGLVVEGNGPVQIAIATENDEASTLAFSSPATNAAAGALVQWVYDSGTMAFRTFKSGAVMKFSAGNDALVWTLEDGGSGASTLTTAQLALNTNHTNQGLAVNNANAAPSGIVVNFTAAHPNNTSDHFFTGLDDQATRVVIWSNGNIQNANNSYGAISDARLKRDVRLAASQWNDVKALSRLVKKFRFISDVASNESAPYLLGWVAQDVQAVSPGLVNEGTDGTLGVQYSIAYMKAFKALGEAMERIERLEAKVA